MKRSIKLALPLAACLALLALSPANASGLERGDPSEPDSSPRHLSPRIVGGSTASTATYTWQAALVLDESFNTNDLNGHLCGGSLITPRIVLTAGHCVEDTDPDCFLSLLLDICLPLDSGGDGTTFADPNDFNVVLGRDTLSTNAGEERNIKAIRIHPSYSVSSSGVPQNDVAFLVLASASARAPIKLAGADERALWEVGRPTEASGWGATSETGSSTNTLRSVTVPIIADSTCASGAVYGGRFNPATMVCAGFLSGGKDACFGDSGGPLQAPGEDAAGDLYRLVGVTSWGIGCARQNRPGVYARVGGGTSLHDAVVSQVFRIENQQGLANWSIVGSGARPRGSTPPPPPAGSAPAGTTVQPRVNKCKSIKNRKKRRFCYAKRRCRAKPTAQKRKRCLRKVKRRFASRASSRPNL